MRRLGYVAAAALPILIISSCLLPTFDNVAASGVGGGGSGGASPEAGPGAEGGAAGEAGAAGSNSVPPDAGR